MVNLNTKLASVILFASLIVSCGGKDNATPEWRWNDPTPKEDPKPDPKPDPKEEDKDPNATIVAAGWTNVTSNYENLPAYINIYRSPAKIADKNVIAWLAVGDITAGAKFEVLGDLYYCNDKSVQNYGADKANTPDEFYAATKAPVIINGGLFFYAPKSDKSSFYASQNLAARDGKLIAVNQNYWVQNWSASPLVMWYPTLGTFIQKNDGTCYAAWTYSKGETTYTYPQPADNSLNKEPLPQPSSTFPEGAELFSAQNAIGGVGVLIKDGTIRNTWEQELLGVQASKSAPRTAIGYTADKKIVFFVCEGRNMTEGVAGLTTGEEARILKDIGCTEALNLDGGGSSCMLIDGKGTIKPSDAKQRRVLTGLKMY